MVSTVVLEDPVGTNVAILLDPSSVDRLDVGAPFVDDLFRTIEREHVSPETVSLDTIPHGVPILPLAAFIAGMRQQEPQVGPIVAAGIPLDGEILTRVVNLITGEHVLEQYFRADENSLVRAKMKLLAAIEQAQHMPFNPRQDYHEPSSKAYWLYLQGRHHWNKRTKSELLVSIEMFQKASEVDPEYLLPRVGIADAYSILGAWHWLPQQDAFSKALQEIEIVLEKNHQLPEAYLARAFVDSHYRGERLLRADQDFQFVMKAAPYNASASQWYGGFLARQGMTDSAIEYLQFAQLRDRVTPIIRADLAWIHYLNGDYEKAAKLLRLLLEGTPNFFPALYYSGLVHLANGQTRRAMESLEKADRISPTSRVLGALGYAYAVADLNEKAKDILTRLEEPSEELSYVSPMDIARVYIGLATSSGDKKFLDHAVHLIKVAATTDEAGFSQIATSPLYKPLRGRPDFDELVKSFENP